VAQSFTRPPEIAILETETGSLTTLTKLNPAFEQVSLLPGIEKRWRNRFGHESKGFLILPADRASSKRIPLIVIHYAFSNRFTAQAQWMTSYPVQHLAAAGIAVLLHNYPRELGWTPGDFEGAAHSQAYNPLASMEAAVEGLVRENQIDAERMGIAGWSFGAWLTEMAITQSKLFRVASAGEGGLNNAGQYWVTGSASMQKYLDAFFGGPPFGEAYANYKKLAPALNADRVSTPLLREYGSDVGVQSLEFYMALRRLGKPVEQFVYPGAPHIFDLPSHRRASLERNLDWFRFWLQDFEDTDPRKSQQYERWRAMRENDRVR
jgi:dipeptidyl aminopeptidase/acylaminoacyl peptidase